ncbi:MAG: DNA replication protein DnaC, partial [uncultured Caballeronia sp.]
MLLQTLVHQRYKLRRSIIVTSNPRRTGLGWASAEFGEAHLGDARLTQRLVALAR